MKQDKNGITSKWLIEGVEGFCFGSDKELYRLPFQSGRNHFGVRRIKRQDKNRWKIKSVWWSERQLRGKIYLNPNPEVIIREISDCPF